jgi:hypothetical protein
MERSWFRAYWRVVVLVSCVGDGGSGPYNRIVEGTLIDSIVQIPGT